MPTDPSLDTLSPKATTIRETMDSVMIKSQMLMKAGNEKNVDRLLLYNFITGVRLGFLLIDKTQ